MTGAPEGEFGGVDGTRTPSVSEEKRIGPRVNDLPWFVSELR